MLSIFKKKEPAFAGVDPGPIGRESAAEPASRQKQEDAVWAMAARHHDDRFLRVAAHARNWRRFAGFCLILAGGAVWGLVHVASQSKIVPYLIEVDKLGRTIAVRAVAGKDAVTDPKRLVFREMIEFFENSRTITRDFSANNTFMNRAFARLQGGAYDYVKRELRARKPNELASTRSVLVNVTSAIPVTETLWTVEWTETSFNVKGDEMGIPERWKANVSYELNPGSTEEELAHNPIGFTITSISWAKQM